MFKFTTSWKNDGGSHTHNALERGLQQALSSMYSQGVWDWGKITVRRLECDDIENHYPDLCYHYEFTIE